MYEAVVFDADGVLLDRHVNHPDAYGQAVVEAFRTFDVDLPASDVGAFVGAATLEGMREVCDRHGVDFETFWPERERRMAALQRRMMERGERDLYDDCAVLPELTGTCVLAIVSNNQHETIRHMVDRFSLADHFETVYGREPHVEGFERTKPDPHYLERALEDLGTRSGLYVGDSAADVIAAHRTELDSAFVRRSHREGYELPETPTYEIESLAELPGIVERG